MKLLTPELEKQLDEATYYGEKAICKFFNPCGAGTWIIFGRDADQPDILFCVADLGMDCVEGGSVSLSELESLRLPFELTIERDLWFEPGKSLKHYLELETLAGV